MGWSPPTSMSEYEYELPGQKGRNRALNRETSMLCSFTSTDLFISFSHYTGNYLGVGILPYL